MAREEKQIGLFFYLASRSGPAEYGIAAAGY
jgi:hypothetical protein